MSKQGTLFNLGILLKWAEQGLTKAFIVLEKRIDKHLLQGYQNDTPKMIATPNKKARKQELRELARSQDHQLARLESLEKSKAEMSQEIENDKT